MAELRDLRPIDVTRGVRTGVDIARGVQALKSDKASEERAKVTFELQKQASEQALQLQAKREMDRIADRKIDLLESRIEMGFRNKNFRAVDEARAEWEQVTGFTFGGDTEELANLLADRRRAEKAKDAEEVERIDDYLQSVRRMSPEEAAGVLGLETEKEEFAEERKFERKLGQEEQVFDITEARRKATQAETETETRVALEGIEGLDETTKSLLPLVAGGKVPANVLNLLSGQTGVTYQRGVAGTGANEGKTVTIALDKSGKKISEFVQSTAKDITQTSIQKTTDMFGNETVQGYVISEDVNGNPFLKILKPQQPEREEAVEPKKAALKLKLEELGSSGDLTPEAFLATLKGTEAATEEEIIAKYKELLAERGVKQEEPEGEEPGLLGRIFGKKAKPKREPIPSEVTPPTKKEFTDRFLTDEKFRDLAIKNWKKFSEREGRVPVKIDITFANEVFEVLRGI